MRIFYHLSHYISHRTSGLAYASCLRSLGHVVSHTPDDIPSSSLAVLHDDPLNYAGLFARYPALATVKTAACCVWENELLPAAYADALRLAGAIWTPSGFSRQSMAALFPHTRLLPHVVRRVPVSSEDMAFARAVFAPAGDGCRFFSIVDSINPRKNVGALLAAFRAAAKRSGRPMTLLLKQYRCSFDYSGIPGVISLDGDLSFGRMAALHIASDAYVSAHHAEGWGLGLSEAMAYGKLVIATGYSGNMEYMDAENSLPVPFRMVPVSAEMCERLPLCTPAMQWADIDLEALTAAMLRVAQGRVPPGLARNAAAITRRFGPEQIAERLRELLAE